MADLETLVNELPKIVNTLRLNIGHSHDIMQQIAMINNAQDKLRNIQETISQKVNSNQLEKSPISTLACRDTAHNPFNSGGFTVYLYKYDYPGLLTAKFGQLPVDITLEEIQAKIEVWIDWGDLIQAIAADILSDIQLVKQFNIDATHDSIPTTFQAAEEILKIQLDLLQPKLLQQQIQQIIKAEADSLKVKQRLEFIFDNIKNSQGLLKILLGVSSFCGKTGFALEWLDDDQELIISGDGKLQELTDIINECEFYQDKIDSLILQLSSLRVKAEKYLLNPKLGRNQLQKNLQKQKLVYSFSMMAASLLALSFGSWIIKAENPQLRQFNLNYNSEETAIANFKAAQTFGLEASRLAQTPPHPLIVWQQAQFKWQEAIKLLESIPKTTSIAAQSQEKLTRYRFYHHAIAQRVIIEKKALANLEAAHKLAIEAHFFVQSSPHSLSVRQQAQEKWQQAINLLKEVPKNTFVYQQAQETLQNYQTNFQQLSVSSYQ
ncbi:hypothetical protein H6G76_23350 [Nostoc sp. FACHB-152]|uniref:hypothetical protein n=1 Tax=unclassified Nostoc TaxID=2593658 RepID=UPI0016867FF9|nr:MULTISPECIES: hypothetical protein [unclassified Nostoc]MBD2450045.1 hypothetical protein [Nostoc sp. FACHB-152]MBD2470165.1 hypothetical protein [Nostoc sp. FACHB-145]